MLIIIVQVDLAMWNISIHGIDDIKLEKLVLERGQALNKLREKAIIDIGNLTIKGMYKYTAQCTNWFCIVDSLDSEVQKNFIFQKRVLFIFRREINHFK